MIVDRAKRVREIMKSDATPFLVGRVGRFGEPYLLKSGTDHRPFPARKHWSVRPCPITVDHGEEQLGHTQYNAGLHVVQNCLTFLLCVDTPELMERVEEILPRIKGASVGWQEWKSTGKCRPTHVSIMVDGTPKHKSTRVALAWGLDDAHKQLAEMDDELGRVILKTTQPVAWEPSPDVYDLIRKGL